MFEEFEEFEKRGIKKLEKQMAQDALNKNKKILCIDSMSKSSRIK